MTTFFRVQKKGISFDEMMRYDSIHANEDDDEFRPGGLAASMSPSGREGGGQFGGAPMDDTMEVVIFTGRTIQQIYDGWLVKPVAEIARFECDEWLDMLETGAAYEYEDW